MKVYVLYRSDIQIIGGEAYIDDDFKGVTSSLDAAKAWKQSYKKVKRDFERENGYDYPYDTHGFNEHEMND